MTVSHTNSLLKRRKKTAKADYKLTKRIQRCDVPVISTVAAFLIK